jgi:cytochrome c oxidase assembly protein subunit 15
MPFDSRQRIAASLLLVCAFVFAMVVVGGVTRLTHSGLSIVEWQPIVGTVPPLTDAQWNETFKKYQQTPEYQKVNVGMSLDAFQSIFYVEWAHRVLGRLTFFISLIPLGLAFLANGMDPKLKWKLAAVPVLIALQGALGWLMVASGLVDIPRVSPYRLTAHLGLAVAIYAYAFWLALSLAAGNASASAPKLVRLSKTVAVLIFVMILTGGFVAGTRAGFAYNTFPLMNGQWFPVGMFAQEPWWVNFFENGGTVQFIHRLMAYVVIAHALMLGWRLRRASHSAPLRWGNRWLLAALVLQVTLGITTLLWVVPVGLAAAHQGGALLLFTASLYLAHRLAHGQSLSKPA